VRKSVAVKERLGQERLGHARLNFGLASLLAQSEAVSRAFGRRLGFALMVTAILTGSSMTAAGMLLIARGITKLF
jgi:hypothetical protein